jgi:hypothetical protein
MTIALLSSIASNANSFFECKLFGSFGRNTLSKHENLFHFINITTLNLGRC